MIEKESFKDLYLSKINISNNALAKIERNSFINCVNITVLDLSNNQIQAIERAAFDETSYATVFQLSYNRIYNLSMV